MFILRGFYVIKMSTSYTAQGEEKVKIKYGGPFKYIEVSLDLHIN
jgi:hypothetical protein